MKSPTLRTQLVLAAGLVQLYSLGVGASYWLQDRAHQRLERSLQEGLTVLSSLPKLRDNLRALDQAGDQYLLTGQEPWLDRREETLARVRADLAGLSEGLESGDAGIAAEADARLTAYLAERAPWISRRRSGRLPAAEAAAAARRSDELDAAIEALDRLKDINVEELRVRRLDVERAARTTLGLILLAGAAAAGFVAWLLSRTLIGPVAALRRRAHGWTLGTPWDFPPLDAAGPEVADLELSIGEMARRLNAQFEKEAELGRLKGRLVSMASHEFNNALSVLGGTEYLLRQTETPAPAGRRAEYYDIIEANLKSLSLATSNLLDLGRLESGKLSVQPRQADLRRVLADAARALRLLSERKRLDLAIEVPEGAPPALGDPEALVLVAVNLLGNAIKYTPEGGKVRAGAESKDGAVRVYVRDSGIGIKPEDRARVMQGHRTEEGKKAATGFGVGLTLVSSVLEAHGSALAIDDAPGGGTEVSFILPRWQGPTKSDELVGD